MKNTKKAFTLVELIVVITILAVLATVAFISLTGHAQDAKNTKVNSDVAVLAKAIDTAITQGTVSTKNIVGTELTSHNAVGNVTKTEKTGTSALNLATASSDVYKTGNVNFGAIQQNGDDFVDNDGNKYIAGSVASGSLARYQVAGQIKEASGDVKSIVKGNYVVITTGDAAGLIAQSGSTVIENNKTLPTAGQDIYGATVN